MTTQDTYFMQMAISLGKRGLGRTAPNPSVGCVIVKHGKIIGRGVTADGGSPHAETIATGQAGRDAADSDVYLTLEPCAHKGKSGACTQTLIKARVKRVIIAMIDPNPAVNGKGVAALKNAGITVVTGTLEQQAQNLHLGFTLSKTQNRPFITLKMGCSLDGKITASDGSSQWITCPEARQYSHLLRYRHDAIMVGIETVLKDNPSLTCRLAGLEQYSPIRIVMDSKLRTPSDAKIVTTANDIPTHIFTTRDTGSDARPPAIVQRIRSSDSNTVDLAESLAHCSNNLGITSLLVEGGSRLAASFIRERLIDRIEWIQAPGFIGAGGLSSIGNAGARTEQSLLDGERHYKTIEQRSLGSDQLTVLERIS